MLKNGAMFGLDARIALAIFGALSVISGAALYSAITIAKNEQARQYFEEHINASSEYYLNNGKELPVFPEALDSGDYDYLYVRDFSVNRESLQTWEGPYIAGDDINDTQLKDYFTNSLHSSITYMMYLRQSSTWTQMDDINADEFCAVGSSDCAEWHTVYASGGSTVSRDAILNLFNQLDSYIDNNDGALSGTVRYNSYAGGSVMYKGRPRKQI